LTQVLTLAMFFAIAGVANSMTPREIFVSPIGRDSNPGTIDQPLHTLGAAQLVARKFGSGTTVTVRAGVYYLKHELRFEPIDSGIRFRAYEGERPVISGGFLITPHWSPYRNGILQSQLPIDVDTDRLFVNGIDQPLARYPNFDPNAKIFNGVSADALSPDRVKGWSNPAGGFIHALHAYEWGDVHYLITGRDKAGNLTYEGGWQNNRPMGMRKDSVFVEGIFEELDATGEWFLNRQTHTLYYYPPAGLDLEHARIEGVRLPCLIHIDGSDQDPVRNLSFEGLTFTQTQRTFMQNREPLLRSDWTIYRGGAIFATGSKSCSIVGCSFESVGGNAIFVSGFNRKFAVKDSLIENAGANGVSFVGDPSAVRSPLFNYDQRQSYADLDLTPGPKNDLYPSECLVQDCLITRTGRIEKQSAPIEISMSRRITVRHCSIYDVPRAGINIGDGCWGGDVIEGCDIFDTVKETGDHGSFNSWGRDRYWGLKDVDLNQLDKSGKAELPLLDTIEPITLRNNRWRCDHGWDIDLDDGSTNYRIMDNLCLHGGIKLREGFFRDCENNVIVDNSFHFHVWFKDSQDTIRRNIVGEPYHVIEVSKPFGRQCDDNFLNSSDKGIELSTQSGRDSHSEAGNAQFIDPAVGDYRVKQSSKALTLGFKNFPMDQFGVTNPTLKAMARTPELPLDQVQPTGLSSADRQADWLGGMIKNLMGLGERSAVGLGSESGVLVTQVPSGSFADKIGLLPLDVILQLDGRAIVTMADLVREMKNDPTGWKVTLTVWRGQRQVQFSVSIPGDVAQRIPHTQ
jgi:hypothetical protein